MRPILLTGHTRSLTKIAYNKDGDLLFSVSKDNKPCVWYSHNGERLGTFIGHNGAVWDLSVSGDSQYLLTGSADNSARLWKTSTGESLFEWVTLSPVRAIAFSEGHKQFLMVTDNTMGQKSTLHVFDLNFESLTKQSTKPVSQLVFEKSRATVAEWGPLNKTIVTGHEDGSLNVWDAKTLKCIYSSKSHTGLIQDLQFSNDKGYFITASKDNTALIHDYETLKVLKRYETERPVNAAAISPIREHIALGGGQEAMSVTTTSAKQGKFEVRFYHLVFEEEIGRVKGHFGPINTLAFHPNGRGFASGGEDGFIRIHHFDDDYFRFKYDEETGELEQ